MEELLVKVSAELKKLDLDDFKIYFEGTHLTIVAVGDVFNHLSLLKKQQYIMAAVKCFIASGELHAVNIKTYTPEQWKIEKHLY